MEVLLESVSHQFPGLRSTNPISPVLGVVLEVLRYDAVLFHGMVAKIYRRVVGDETIQQISRVISEQTRQWNLGTKVADIH